jgi:glutamate-1-semialdehyde aminotransferase
LSAAAGIAALGRIAGGAPCRAAEGYAQALRERLNALFRELEAPLAAYGFSSIFHLLTAPPAAAQLLRDGEVEAVDLSVEILKKKHPLDYLLRRALQLEGVDLPAGKQAWISEAHGEEELTETLAAFGRAIALLRGLHCF